jgi:hypothetical protein
VGGQLQNKTHQSPKLMSFVLASKLLCWRQLSEAQAYLLRVS